MKTLGIDIGTTTLSFVVRSCASGVLETVSTASGAFEPGQPWERLQNPDAIFDRVSGCVDDLLSRFPDVAAIGVTGQMHGVVYLGADGRAVSPLYTWQDGRGDLPCDASRSWAARLSEVTGYPLASGYGMVTHDYNACNGLVPPQAVSLCTIADYVAMRLAGLTAPQMDASNAASLGLFDLVGGCFDRAALQKANIDASMLPSLAQSPVLGAGPRGVPVCAAIGDNQASFLGATAGQRDALLVNMGTGGQVSVYTRDYLQTNALETRPFPGGGFLLVGASLCGGRSYALLEQFFRQTVKMITGEEVPAYGAMARMLETAAPVGDLPVTATTFQGTRANPALRGSICGLSADNFTPQHLTVSVMRGMAQELHDLFRSYLDRGGSRPAAMIGAGNALRKNPFLRRVFEEVFGAPMTLSDHDEEAACGAALYAAQSINASL